MPRQFSTWLCNAVTDFDAAVRELIKEVAPNVTYSGVVFCLNPTSIDAYKKLTYQVSAHFLGMPQTPISRKHTENVYVIGLFEGVVINKIVRLKSYATEVSYCRMNDLSNQTGDLQVMAGFHYDFESTSKINHPIFHAQPKLSAGQRYFDVHTEITPPLLPDKNTEIRTLRIPTPQMDIFSTIVMILADHIVQEKSQAPFKKFLEIVSPLLLPINFDGSTIDVSKKFLDTHPVHIHNWYPMN